MASRKSKAKSSGSESGPPWELLAGYRSTLFSKGASRAVIDHCEQQLGVKLPKALVELLQWRDGGLFANKRFVLFSAGKGLHPDETLLAANAGIDPDCPLLNIGRDATYSFGFRKNNLHTPNPPVCVYIHAEGTAEEIAPNLASWLVWAMQQSQGRS
jgi:hypothetical protein